MLAPSISREVEQHIRKWRMRDDEDNTTEAECQCKEKRKIRTSKERDIHEAHTPMPDNLMSTL